MTDKRKGDMAYPSASEVMLCWNDDSDQVRLFDWPDNKNLSHRYEKTTLACYTWAQNATFEQLKTMCFIEAMHLIIRDGCDPKAVHNALKGVREYRDGCAGDMLNV